MTCVSEVRQPGISPMMPDSKKRQEEALIKEFLYASQFDPGDWVLHHHERPDFLATSPTGTTYGIELTELLTQSQGEDRATDSRVADAIREVIREFLTAQGGTGGATVFGTTTHLPPRAPRSNDLTRAFRCHLKQFGSALAANNGVLDRRYKGDHFVVEWIHRLDEIDRVILNECGPSSLAHKSGRLDKDLEASLEHAVTVKVEKAQGYERRFPLWLVIRNPNQRIRSVSDECRTMVHSDNHDTFARIILLNFPLDRFDPHPPEPRILDLV